MKNIFKAKNQTVIEKKNSVQSINFFHKQHHFKIDIIEGTPSLARVIQMCNFMIANNFKRYELCENEKYNHFIVWRV